MAATSTGGAEAVAACRSRAETAGAEVGGLVIDDDLSARVRSCSDQLKASPMCKFQSAHPGMIIKGDSMEVKKTNLAL